MSEAFLLGFNNQANQAPVGIDDVSIGAVTVGSETSRLRLPPRRHETGGLIGAIIGGFSLKPASLRPGRLSESLEELCAAAFPSHANHTFMHVSRQPAYSYRLAQRILMRKCETFASCDAGPFIQFPNGCIVMFRSSDESEHVRSLDDPDWQAYIDILDW